MVGQGRGPAGRTAGRLVGRQNRVRIELQAIQQDGPREETTISNGGRTALKSTRVLTCPLDGDRMMLSAVGGHIRRKHPHLLDDEAKRLFEFLKGGSG